MSNKKHDGLLLDPNSDYTEWAEKMKSEPEQSEEEIENEIWNRRLDGYKSDSNTSELRKAAEDIKESILRLNLGEIRRVLEALKDIHGKIIFPEELESLESAVKSEQKYLIQEQRRSQISAMLVRLSNDEEETAHAA